MYALVAAVVIATPAAYVGDEHQSIAHDLTDALLECLP
jgi:hypothetical protein